ncbi:MAG: GNAT family N-acetyltransferase [Anaerolineae bacterium]|nr:GNAT family N-acetyltransferase [Anaerolineae bacterium]
MEGGGLPQLRMQLSLTREVWAPPIAPGYELRLLAEEGMEDWIAVLNSTGDLGCWTVERAHRAIGPGGRSMVPAEAIQMAYHAGRPVATACLTVHPDCGDAELGWVAVHPGHRRRGLGRLVCAAVLQDMRLRGYRRAFLLTDDHRSSAILLYWLMGFRPELTHPSHRQRWEGLAQRLGLAPDGA